MCGMKFNFFFLQKTKDAYKSVLGSPPSFIIRRCPMEHLLLDLLVAIVAGVVVALIVKRINR